ncbi:DNA helicase [Cupriavidus campinensis]|uniref:DNA helicase n=2 Tax=Cupriavidus campinensis TaxID=151783 RepID=A0ABY3ETN8_9BURK|nr:DNA helicase [Cupriavidus campinensis]
MEHEPSKFEFDEDFQLKVAALVVRDFDFARKAAHLIKPDYFEDMGIATIVDMGIAYYNKYGEVADATALRDVMKDRLAGGKIRSESKPLVFEAFKKVFKHELGGGTYVAEQVATFARHTAISHAILQSVSLLDKKKLDAIDKLIGQASAVGLNEDGDEYDYYATIQERTDERLETVAGKRPPQGITTGHSRIDERLYHRGWGRKEMVVFMGGPKSGKTMALINSAKIASQNGFNVLYITLEVAARIIGERLDASFSGHKMRELLRNPHDVRMKVESAAAGRRGSLVINEFPPGTLTPKMLRALIERHKAKGRHFDLICVDYADLMAPDFRGNEERENSKQIYTGLRAIAVEQGVALLTATQTNRTGAKAIVAKAEDVAEDYNKIRIADLVISINSTDEEKLTGDARLFFAASRNQEGGFTIYIKQDLGRAQFIVSVENIE